MGLMIERLIGLGTGWQLQQACREKVQTLGCEGEVVKLWPVMAALWRAVDHVLI